MSTWSSVQCDAECIYNTLPAPGAGVQHNEEYTASPTYLVQVQVYNTTTSVPASLPGPGDPPQAEGAGQVEKESAPHSSLSTVTPSLGSPCLFENCHTLSPWDLSHRPSLVHHHPQPLHLPHHPQPLSLHHHLQPSVLCPAPPPLAHPSQSVMWPMGGLVGRVSQWSGGSL